MNDRRDLTSHFESVTHILNHVKGKARHLIGVDDAGRLQSLRRMAGR